jgi:peptidoglycan-associated lipoprotein
MKKIITLMVVVGLVFAVSASCKKKVQTVPAPPQAQEQPTPAKVDESAKVAPPALSEEELFMSKSLDQINQEKPLTIVYFDFDKYDIRDDAKPGLEHNATWLKTFKTAKILIEGHCDERGTEDYNLALGEKRAKTVMDYLTSLGIASARMKVISYGKSQPADPGHDEAAWQKNRRAQFLVIEK